jgi:hypothetical protein
MLLHHTAHMALHSMCMPPPEASGLEGVLNSSCHDEPSRQAVIAFNKKNVQN